MENIFNDFNEGLKYLKPKVRAKAIELANQFIADGKHPDHREALKEGIKQRNGFWTWRVNYKPYL